MNVSKYLYEKCFVKFKIHFMKLSKVCIQEFNDLDSISSLFRLKANLVIFCFTLIQKIYYD